VKLLLDTQAFLWLVGGSPKLSRKAVRAFEDEGNELSFSLASAWEMAIKISLGKLEIDSPLQSFLPTQLAANGIAQLDITFRHVCRVGQLPFHHRDPFDRLLAAQCLEDDFTILSSDPVFERYGVKRIW
jgi:PIN domain nuclease of toxin-antitoxin system